MLKHIEKIFAVDWATFSLGKAKLALYRWRGEGAEGVFFAVGLSAQTIYNDDQEDLCPT